MTLPIIALDFSSKEEVHAFLKQFDEQLFVKVGMELFYAYGPEIIKEIKAEGHHIFLDLKLYDIPNTVGRAMKNIGKLNVDMTNVHAQGGTAMMKRALESFKDENPNGQLIAVTQLTSMSDKSVTFEQMSQLSLHESVLHYAQLTYDAGLDGVVSSPLESKGIHSTISKDFLTVTPGIRLKEDSHDDQVRVVTPNDAKKLGSNYIVVGRSITRSESPFNKYKEVKKLWGSAE